LYELHGLLTFESAPQVFDSVSRWICFVHKKQKVSLPSKTVVFYKGQSLKEWEQVLMQSSGGETGIQHSSEAANGLDGDDEIGLAVDMERRKREYKAAVRRVEKGFRVEPLGYDSALRSYWLFQSLLDSSSQVVWVCEPGACKGGLPGRGDHHDAAPGDASPDFLAGSNSRKIGTKRAANIPRDEWHRFTTADGSLQRLCEYFLQHPQGLRESRLLELLQNLTSKSLAAEKKVEGASAENVVVDLRESVAPQEEYVWNEIPEIGDIVWARKRSETRSGVSYSWHPVKLVDPKAEEPLTEDEEVEDPFEEDDDEEWHKSGSEFIGKRVLMTIRDDASGSDYTETGRVFGWLPADVADFKSDQGEYVALWRVKFDDRHVTSQDLEELEVKEAIAKYSRAQAVKRNKESEYLSQTSMFGQKIKWVHGQYMNTREQVETFSISDILPYDAFRAKRMQELEALGSSKILAQVQKADDYLEERNVGETGGDNIKEVLLELGLGGMVGVDLSPELEAACRSCLQQPRVMAVVERGQDRLRAVCTVDELIAQLFAVVDCLKVQCDALVTLTLVDIYHSHAVWRSPLMSARRCAGVIRALSRAPANAQLRAQSPAKVCCGGRYHSSATRRTSSRFVLGEKLRLQPTPCQGSQRRCGLSMSCCVTSWTRLRSRKRRGSTSASGAAKATSGSGSVCAGPCVVGRGGRQSS
jgi:hypothetical protein